MDQEVKERCTHPLILGHGGSMGRSPLKDRLIPVHAEAVVKGTNADGVLVCDSRNNNVTADRISFAELISGGTGPVNAMALRSCQENAIPVVVFNLHEPGNISRALCGKEVGTLIHQTGALTYCYFPG